AGPIYKIQIQDYIIHPVTGEYIEKTIDKAVQDKAQAVLIVLDTPGGLLQTTHQIVKKIMNVKVPVIVYVAPAGARAASAGTFITLAAHVAAMAPATHIGAAHPVMLGEGEEMGFEKIKEKLKKEDAKEIREPKAPIDDKIMQDTLAWMENIAKARHRNIQWAKWAVTKSLSSTAEEALKESVIDFIAADEAELMRKLNGRKIELAAETVTLSTAEAPVITIPMNWRQSILNVLIHPNIAYILLVLGFYGLLFEITHPGSWLPGISGTICILLAFYSFHVIPPDYAGIILTVLGLLLFAAEVWVTSHGLFAIGGLVCLFFGALFLIDAPAEFLRVSLHVIVPTLIASTAILGLLMTLVIRAQRSKAQTGSESLIGEIAIVDTDLNPTGKVFVLGEIWDAEIDDPKAGHIKKGDKVEILKIENLKLTVKRSSDNG
ncbi:MAG: nodulation protein NfeD, partial [bacterium]|nr:nodulation protein NfeD [bacterium]